MNCIGLGEGGMGIKLWGKVALDEGVGVQSPSARQRGIEVHLLFKSPGPVHGDSRESFTS